MELTIIPSDEPRKLAPCLLSLPRELRNIIYQYALVELARRDRRHNGICLHRPRGCEKTEYPLFMPLKEKLCNCVGRRGIHLLCVSRRVHAEAAPIFWSQNVFSWEVPSDFSDEVGSRLRPEYRALIHHVSLLPTRTMAFAQPHPSLHRSFEAFWPVLLQCTGLRSIEISPCLMFKFVPDMQGVKILSLNHLDEMKRELSNLKTLTWVNLEEYRVYVAKKKDPRPSACTLWAPQSSRLDWVFPMLSQRIDVASLCSKEAALEAVRRFNLNFVVHCRFAIETLVFNRPPGLFGPRRPTLTMRLPPGMNADDDAKVLALRDGTKTTVKFYGLPISPETRRRHSRESWKHDHELRARGQPTRSEARAKEQVAERKALKKVKEEQNERAREAAEKNSKRRYREWNKKEEQRALEELELAKKNEFEDAVRLAKKDRIESRRRVRGDAY